MNEILRDLINEEKVMAFLNDVLVGTETKKGHDKIVEEILRRLEENDLYIERDKRDVYCDKQVEAVVTVLNCMLKGLWGERESGGIRKKLKSKSATYL